MQGIGTFRPSPKLGLDASKLYLSHGRVFEAMPYCSSNCYRPACHFLNILPISFPLTISAKSVFAFRPCSPHSLG